MNKRLPTSFWIESAVAVFTAFLVVLTAAWRDWIEGVLGFDPDHHNGAFEWELVTICCLLTVTFGLLARGKWRKTLAVS